MIEKKEKWIWDIGFDEAEQIYRQLHMNNYVYSALSVFHRSQMPLNRFLSPRQQKIPACLLQPTEKLLDLSPHLGNDDPKQVRIHYIILSYHLFRELRHISFEQIDIVAGLLGALAYIPTVADKNDNHLLWKRPVIREKTERLIRLFNAINEKTGVEDFVEMALYEDEKINENTTPYFFASRFVTRAVGCIIGMIENNIEKPKAAKAFELVDRHLNDYEQKCGLTFDAHPNHGDMRFNSQLRYRNTLYLYGGNLFEKMGDGEKAFSWYVKNIYFIDLPKKFEFYLTGFKTTERLLCALRVSPQHKENILLRDLIKTCLLKSFHDCSAYSRVVLDFIETNNNLDLSEERFFLKNKKFMLFGGESSREPYLISLLYNKIMNEIEYENPGYEGFFK